MSTPADITVLIDAPPLPVRDGRPVGSHAAGIAETLDWAHAAGFGHGGAAPVVVVRRGADPDSDDAIAQHPARPGVIRLPDRRPGVDPEGWVLSTMRTPFALTLHPGVRPDPSEEDPLPRMLGHLDENRPTAALTTRITRVDGADEAHPLPDVLHRGAALLRVRAVQRAGGFSRLLPPGGAADLDLTCRFLRVGRRARRDDGVRFVRRAWPEPTLPSDREVSTTLRDALIVQDRYLPRVLRRLMRRDTIGRAIATQHGSDGRAALSKAVQQARRNADWERSRGRSVLPGDRLERLLRWDRTRQAVTNWAVREHPRRVVLAGWDPNLYGAFHAARRIGLHVVAIAEDTPTTPETRYRGVPVVPLRDAIDGRTEGVIVTDQHPATAAETTRRVAERFAGPMLTLWKPVRVCRSARSTDDTVFLLRIAA